MYPSQKTKAEIPVALAPSAPAAVSTLLTVPKRSWVQRIKRYFRGTDLDEAEGAGSASSTRLPEPLSFSVSAVATGQLITNGLGVVATAALLGGGALFVVGSPFYFGRVGVGYSLITLFGMSLVAVAATIPFFVARGAARILRRDPRGIRPVYLWACVAAVMSLAAAAAVLAVPIFGNRSDGASTVSMVRGLVNAFSSLAFQIWTIVVLRKYKIEAAEEIAAAERESVAASLKSKPADLR